MLSGEEGRHTYFTSKNLDILEATKNITGAVGLDFKILDDGSFYDLQDSSLRIVRSDYGRAGEADNPLSEKASGHSEEGTAFET